MQTLCPTFEHKFTVGDCAEGLAKLKANNTHCSSLVFSSQKVISIITKQYALLAFQMFCFIWLFCGEKTV